MKRTETERRLDRQAGGRGEGETILNTSNSRSSWNAPAHFVSAFCIIFLKCFPGSVLASSFMVATSVAVIRSRNESMWERREAATCVRRERKEGGRERKEGEKERREERKEGKKGGRERKEGEKERRERKKGGRERKEGEKERREELHVL